MVPSVMQVHGHERKSQAAINKSTDQDLAEIGNTQGFCRNDPPPLGWVQGCMQGLVCPRWAAVHISP